MYSLYNKKTQEYENELIVVCSRKGAKSYDSIADLQKDWADVSPEEEQGGGFDWAAAKDNLIKTDCGITLCRQDYSERYKKYFTFDEALEIEKEAKKHGFRLPTVQDFEKLYAYYGVDKDGNDTPQRFVDELGFSYSGYWDSASSSASDLGSYGYYWSSSVFDTGGGYLLYFNSSNVYPQYSNYKYYRLTLKFIYDPEGAKDEVKE